MLPALARTPELVDLVRRQDYFILHAPRQVGKTTAMIALVPKLCELGFVAIHVSLLESRGLTETSAAEPIWLDAIESSAQCALPEDEWPPPLAPTLAHPVGTRLRNYLSAWSRAVKKPIVLLLDEADAVQGEAMMSLLAQLRSGFEKRAVGIFPTSIGLIGLRNLRGYIVEVRGRPHSPSSPFNNAISFTLRNFNRDEVAALYQQHTDDTGQKFLPETVDAAMLWTEGQPYLVNALARHAVTEQVSDRTQPIRPAHIERAKDALILARVTHLDHLAERLNEARVARILTPVLLGEGEVASLSDDFQYCVDLGLIRRASPISVTNPIYREVLARVLTQQRQDSLPDLSARWRTSDGRINFPALVDAFREFWRENADVLQESDSFYREATPQIVFMAFVQSAVNGEGRVTREYAAGRGRIDLLIETRGDRHVVELKRAKTASALAIARRDGEQQLAEYLDTTGMREGWLLVFDLRPTPSWEEKLWCEDVERGGLVLHLRGV